LPAQDLPIVETAVEELVGPPAPGEPVATVKAELTVKGKKKKKKGEKAALAGEVDEADKEWLAEVCPLEEEHGGTWLDRSQQRLGWGVCRATLWFDGLFGDERAIEERDATYGYVQPKISWNEIDGVDPDVRLRAKINWSASATHRCAATAGDSTSTPASSSRHRSRSSARPVIAGTGS
jgi:hypothetical protein